MTIRFHMRVTSVPLVVKFVCKLLCHENYEVYQKKYSYISEECLRFSVNLCLRKKKLY